MFHVNCQSLSVCLWMSQLKGMPPKYTTFHIDVITADGFSYRFSFSNVFRASKLSGRVAQIPTL